MTRFLGFSRSEMRRAVAAVGIGAALAVATPYSEGIVRTAYAQQAASYQREATPFLLNAEIKELVAECNKGSNREKVEKLHKLLNKESREGVFAVEMKGNPPRTAIEALEKGGDCTDLANLVVAMLREMNVPGGVMVVHFNSAPKDVFHMLPYVKLDGKKVVVDLQSGKLGKTADGKYTVKMELDYDQATAMYHAEWGDYFREKGKVNDSIAAYEKSLEIFTGDAYVHYNLAIMYEKAGDMEWAADHLKEAAKLDPKYAKQTARGSYNEELKKGERAYNQKKWAECVEHFQNALDSGEKLRAEEVKVIEQYRDACKERE